MVGFSAEARNANLNLSNRGVHLVSGAPEMEALKPACRDVLPVAETLPRKSSLFGPPNAPEG
ncbi:hypothetical protein [Spirosoma sp.]|uniref:hypothetical protein n=1 Tax=Spirosoma sp. TaxID=1899569 RepID=UPI00261B7DDF|nr:hypothetical protein [Spirosoma sp.]MCX6215354.1 hypothetical protein [Spirosoma sp.]